MYKQFYGFRENPFSLLPDPDFLYVSREHGIALNLLELGVLNQSGFCVISGEIGAGKTTIVRELLNRLDDQVIVGLITNTHASFDDLMRWILAAFNLKAESEDGVVMHRTFTNFVTEQFQSGKHTLLIIDEAQNLSVGALEQLRMLSNINSGSDLLLQVVLVGQGELREKLGRPELEQFAQRISIDYFLKSLGETETTAYIEHRVTHAGGNNPLFDSQACARIYRHSGGIPRVINRLCDLSLVYGYAENARTIGAKLIDAVVTEHKFSKSDISDVATEPTAAPQEAIMEEPVNNKKDIGGSAMNTASQEKQHETDQPAMVEIEVIPAEEAVQRLQEAEQAAGDKAEQAMAAVEAAAADLATSQKAAASKLEVEQRLVEVVNADEGASQLAKAANSAAEIAATERSASEAEVLETTKAAELAAEKVHLEMTAAEQQIADQLKVEEEAIKAALEATTAAEKALAEKVAAEKAATEVAAACEARVKEASESRIAAEAEVVTRLADAEQAADLAQAEQNRASQTVAQKIANAKEAGAQAKACAASAKEKAAARTEVQQRTEAATSIAKEAQAAADASRMAAEQAVEEQTNAEKKVDACATVEKVAMASVAAEKAAEALKAAEMADAAKEAALREAEEKQASAAAAAEFAAKAMAAANQAAGTGTNAEPDSVVEVQPMLRPLTDEPAMKELLHAEEAVIVPDVEAQRQNKSGRTWAVMAITAVVASGTWFVTQPGDSASGTSTAALIDKAAAPLQHSADIVVEAAAMEIKR